MPKITVKLPVEVTLDIDEAYAAQITKEDAIEMAVNAVSCSYGAGTQLIVGGKLIWLDENRLINKTKNDDPVNAVYADAVTECDDMEAEVMDVDDEFEKVEE